MPPESRESQEPPARTRVETIGLVGLAVELLLPASLSAALLLFAATYLPWWNLRGRLGIGVFGVLLVALSFVLSVWVDARTLRGRRLAGKSQLLNRADPKSRLVKFVLGGLVIPVAAFAAANLMRLPDRRTPMALAAQLAVRTPVASRESQLASAVIHARGAAGKVAGISALQASGSPAALNQLFRIAAEDPVVSKGARRPAPSRRRSPPTESSRRRGSSNGSPPPAGATSPALREGATRSSATSVPASRR